MPTALLTSTIAVPFLIALGASLALVPVCRLVAHRFGYVAKPSEDRWHRRPVALFGGVAIALTLFGGTVAFGGLRELSVILACGTIIFVVGLVDDVVTLKASTKLIVQIALASVLLFFRYRLNWIPSLTLDMMLTLVWVVGMTNAFNLLDNMDGLCAGIALIVGTALLFDLLPAEAGSTAFFQAKYLAVLLGATAGFLVYNVHPASIFLGDSGSLLLGFSFAALTLGRGQYIAGRSDPASIIAGPLLVLLIPIFDTTLVTASRILSGRSAAVGGKDHSSHRLVALGLSERAAVAVLWLLAVIGGVIGVAVDYFNISWSGLVAVIFVLGMAIFAVYLAGIRVYEDEDTAALREGKVTPLVVDFVYKRRAAEVLLDLCLVTIAYYAAYLLRFEGKDFEQNFSSLYRSLPIVLATQMVAFFALGVYQGVWRYFGLSDTVVVAKAVLAGTIGSQIVILYLFRFDSYSRTVFAIYGVLLIAIVTASRASFRLIGESLQDRKSVV